MSSSTVLIGVERATGRTTRSIMLASAFGATIVTPNERTAQFIRQRAAEIGRRGVSVASVSALSQRGDQFRERIIVDDADVILEELLHHPIAAMTIEGTYLKDW